MSKFIYGPLPAGGTVFGFDAPTVFTFDRAYILSLDPAVQALHIGEVGQIQINDDGSQTPTVALDPAARMSLAMSLAKQGYFIDAWIDAYGADPFLTNQARLTKGTLSIQSAVGSATRAVSINPADYPPFVPPAPQPTPVSAEIVGPLEFGTLYSVMPAGMTLFNSGRLGSGQSVTENGHSYTFTVVPLAAGFGYFWEQTA
jgi:hypothetical protein